MTGVILETKVPIEGMTFTSIDFTRDGSDKITEIEITYLSVIVTYTVTWIPDTTNVDTYTRVIVDA